MILVIMGVSGSGKTTVGRALALSLGWEFQDADDFHPGANIEKMRGGHPLTDEDRQGWLEVLARLIEDRAGQGVSFILACSALKARYRTVLARVPGVEFVHLSGSPELIAQRLRERKGHFLNPDLLSSQFAALEEPDALRIEVDRPVPEILDRIRNHFGLPPIANQERGR